MFNRKNSFVHGGFSGYSHVSFRGEWVMIPVTLNQRILEVLVRWEVAYSEPNWQYILLVYQVFKEVYRIWHRLTCSTITALQPSV